MDTARGHKIVKQKQIRGAVNLNQSDQESDQLIGSTLDDCYQIDNLIGTGATANVYAAHELDSKKPVAVKVLHQHLAADPGLVHRFLDEVQTASLLIHPGIATIFKSGRRKNGQPYFAMELIVGKSLQQILQDQGGWLDYKPALDIFNQICAALGAAHEKGIAHRDFKPENIMLLDPSHSRKELLVKILDFGVAKILPVEGETYFKTTQTGETIGSLLYMSPEQCLDQNVDTRTDIYSLGCVMYHALTGKPPLSGRTAFLTMNAHISSTPESFARVRPGLDLPANLERIIFKAMAKGPGKRYQTVGDLQDDLVKIKKGEAIALADDLLSGYDSFLQKPDFIKRDELVAKPPKPRNASLGIYMLWTALVWESVKYWICFAFIFFSNAQLPSPWILVIPQILNLFVGSALMRPTSRGKNWARILSSIFFSFSIAFNSFLLIGIFTLSSPLPHYSWSEYLEIDAFIVFSLILPVIVPTAAIILLFSKSANQWFTPSKITTAKQIASQKRY